MAIAILIIAIILYTSLIITARLEEKRKQESQKAYEVFLNHWLYNIEPNYRLEKGYPQDWLIRRQYVINRDDKKCGECGRKLDGYFIYSNNWERDLLEKRETRCGVEIKPSERGLLGVATDSGIAVKEKKGFVFYGYRGHIHHITPISKGGDHSLNNLILLCEDCHTHQPGHMYLLREINTRNYERSYDAKIKRARKEYKCAICELTILNGEEYYGGRYGGKLCITCYNRRYKR